MAKQRQISEGYQPVASEGFTGPGNPPTGGSGAIPADAPERNKPPAVSTLLAGKTIRVYEECPRCTGSGTQAFGGACWDCGGDGMVHVPMDLDELKSIIKTIVDAAVAAAFSDPS